jgi:hypothetical protein
MTLGLWPQFQAKRAGLYRTELRVNRTTGAGAALTRLDTTSWTGVNPSLARAGSDALIATARTAVTANALTDNRIIVMAPRYLRLTWGVAGRAIHWLDGD